MASKTTIRISYNPEKDIWTGWLRLAGGKEPIATIVDDDRDAILGDLIDVYAEHNGREYPSKLTVTLGDN